MICRPFHTVEKPDGRPAIEVEVGSKKQQYVRLFLTWIHGRVLKLLSLLVSRGAVVHGSCKDA
jgi:hypothetical protein